MTLKQISEIAGVSVPTVSAALRGKSNVSASTRERITRIARELGYEPHGPASALKTREAGAIGVMTQGWPERLLGSSEILLLQGFSKRVAATDKHIVLLNAEADRTIPSMIARRSVDGAAFFLRPHERSLDWMRSHGVPVVTLDTEPVGDIDSVCADDQGGIAKALDHLASLGHKRIAYVNIIGDQLGPPDSSMIIRQNAYLKAMAERDLRAPAGSETIGAVDDRIAWLIKNDSPTALLCFNDEIALNAIQVLHRLGLRVPEDISVMGIDNADVGLLSSPMLTTMDVPFFEMGALAAKLLLARLKSPEKEVRHEVLPERVVARESTARPSLGDSK